MVALWPDSLSGPGGASVLGPHLRPQTLATATAQMCRIQVNAASSGPHPILLIQQCFILSVFSYQCSIVIFIPQNLGFPDFQI